MNDFMQQIWLGNRVQSYFLVFGVILLVWIFRHYISRFIAGLILGLITRIWKNLDRKEFTSLVKKPLGLFVLVVVSIVALHKLRFPPEANVELYDYRIRTIVHSLGTIILVLSFVWLLLRVIDFIAFILERKANLTLDQSDNQLVVFFRDFFKIVVGIIGILMLLKFAFGFDVSNMLTGLSIIGAAVALALRESLENLIASFIIFFDKPFTTGDLVKVQNITGNVERIGLRSTRIRTDQKTYVTVPNKQMVDSILDNLSLRTQLKAELRLHISLVTPASALEKLVEGIKKILQHGDIEGSTVVMNDIGANAFLINVDYFTGPLTNQEFISVKEEVNLKVLRLMEELKIDIAGAATDIRIEGRINDL
jgi:MscS family membrane protein